MTEIVCGMMQCCTGHWGQIRRGVRVFVNSCDGEEDFSKTRSCEPRRCSSKLTQVSNKEGTLCSKTLEKESNLD